jgi:GNAT superfamily N-acetyltransferase
VTVAASTGEAARPAVEIRALDADAYRSAIPELADLIVDAVASGAGVNFLAGVTRDEAAAWWRAREGDVAAGVTTPFVALDGGRVIGSVLLMGSTNPNSPHRAEIGKVIVLQEHRRRGIAAALMAAAEERARADGRWLLILDTVAGSAADAFYRRLGWTAFGTVPDYALSPDGVPSPATFFWKDLR